MLFLGAFPANAIDISYSAHAIFVFHALFATCYDDEKGLMANH